MSIVNVSSLQTREEGGNVRVIADITFDAIPTVEDLEAIVTAAKQARESTLAARLLDAEKDAARVRAEIAAADAEGKPMAIDAAAIEAKAVADVEEERNPKAVEAAVEVVAEEVVVVDAGPVSEAVQ
jgi:hypothetical protein